MGFIFPKGRISDSNGFFQQNGSFLHEDDVEAEFSSGPGKQMQHRPNISRNLAQNLVMCPPITCNDHIQTIQIVLEFPLRFCTDPNDDICIWKCLTSSAKER